MGLIIFYCLLLFLNIFIVTNSVNNYISVYEQFYFARGNKDRNRIREKMRVYTFTINTSKKDFKTEIKHAGTQMVISIVVLVIILISGYFLFLQTLN